MPQISFYLQAYVVVAGCITAGLIAFGLLRVARSAGVFPEVRRYVLVGFLYLCVTGVLAWFGAFSQFDHFPPTGVFLLLPWILSIVSLCRSSAFARVLARLRMETLFEIQTFRFLAEILLVWLISEKALPHTMSFTGRNFDIVVPLTAPIVSFLFFRKQLVSVEVARRIAILWNLAGFAILTVTVVTGIFSLPTPMRRFFDGESTGIIFSFPFHILPGFWVGLAFSIHVFSLLKLWRERGLRE